jgi:hypothetical protein
MWFQLAPARKIAGDSPLSRKMFERLLSMPPDAVQKGCPAAPQLVHRCLVMAAREPIG